VKLGGEDHEVKDRTHRRPLSVQRTAPTLVVERVSWIADWAELEQTRTAAPLR